MQEIRKGGERLSIYFEEGGILTTVQDEGRYGFQQSGVSPAGPMDARAFHIANILVGNDMGESALEITYMGPKIQFQETNVIAITGGDLHPRIDGMEVPMYEAIRVEAGMKLSFMGPRNGCRGYIAFAGGLDVPVVMGSKTTLVRNHMGGVDGRKLEKGDKIGFCCAKTELPNWKLRKVPKPVYPTKEIVLRVVLGPQEDHFDRDGIRRFFWNSVVITNEFDRMGCRLEREPMPQLGDGNIISDGISCGAIQVPADGKPIIMLVDRQTTGGYPKIGNVISVDLPKLAQAQPGFKIYFVQISLELAQDLYIRERKELVDFENRLRG